LAGGQAAGRGQIRQEKGVEERQLRRFFHGIMLVGADGEHLAFEQPGREFQAPGQPGQVPGQERPVKGQKLPFFVIPAYPLGQIGLQQFLLLGPAAQFAGPAGQGHRHGPAEAGKGHPLNPDGPPLVGEGEHGQHGLALGRGPFLPLVGINLKEFLNGPRHED
jgi:hypothetical protein